MAKKMASRKPKEPQAKPDLPWPVTVVRARYGGAYEGGQWLAFNLDCDQVPQDVFGDDVTCFVFFEETAMVIGRGDTPNQAIWELARRLAP